MWGIYIASHAYMTCPYIIQTKSGRWDFCITPEQVDEASFVDTSAGRKKKLLPRGLPYLNHCIYLLQVFIIFANHLRKI